MDELDDIEIGCDQVDPNAAALIRKLVAVIREQEKRLREAEGWVKYENDRGYRT